MSRRRLAVLALAVLSVGACKKKEPPVAPPPAETVDAEAEARARAEAEAEARRRAEAEAAAREEAMRIARAREALSEVLYFDYDSEQLTAEAEEKLRAKIAILRANPSVEVRVAGHADARGSTEYNLALGQRRAETVRTYLERYGVDGSRVSTITYGEERPAVEGESERAFAQNRRAEFGIVGGEIRTVPSEVL